MVEFDRSAFIGKFQEEVQELLQRLNEGVIALETNPEDRDLIDQMMRDAHTVKGSSRMVGLIEISDVAHRLEDIMVCVRDGVYGYTPAFSDLVFEALDAIVYLAENAGKDVELQIDLESLQARLSDLAETGDPAATAAAAARAASKAAAKPAKKSPARPKKRPKRVPGKVEKMGADRQASAESAEAEAAGGEEHQRPDVLKAKAQPTIRVKTAQLDALLNLVSEVVISQIKAEHRGVDLKDFSHGMNEIWDVWVQVKSEVNALLFESEVKRPTMVEQLNVLDSLLAEHRRGLGDFAKDYVDDASRSSTTVSDLREEGMRMRMLPVSTIFNAYPRAVRDLASRYKKEIDLVIEGGDTELDKKVLEEINDPLVHIMRNAVDHGIESPQEREKAGKPRKGTVRLTARQEGDHIIIEISDDGAGIDSAKVKAAAVKKGYITQTEADAMSDREAMFLIFESGFSTSAIITEISGRGVGMDVVRQFVVDKLKGSLDVHSNKGKGTVFTLQIPLTLAIIRALLVRAGGEVFAIPTGTIDETLREDVSNVIKVEGREVVRRGYRNIPLVRLADLLGIAPPPKNGQKLSIAVIGFSGWRIGYVVDSFIGEQQIVIKTLGSHLRRVDNVAGATILGAGQVVLILNVPDLVANARSLAGLRVGRSSTQAEPGEVVEARRILICEDSFTTRELERSIFEAAGYDVEVAMDGAMGLNKLREGLQVDVVVTDVQMPNMTGFELVRAIRSDELLASLPVVIVTSLERDEEKAEGIEAGADAYITKSVFNQDTLLDTVERLIH